MSDRREQLINEAFFGGIIGLAFLFLELRVASPEARLVSPYNFNMLSSFVFLFILCGFLRIYGVILNNEGFKNWSMYVFKIVVFPYSALATPIAIYNQFIKFLFWIPFPVILMISISLTEISLSIYYNEVKKGMTKDMKRFITSIKETVLVNK